MGRIIVIEDNPVFADYVRKLLASCGFRSACACNCNGARKLFSTMRDDDTVLADLRLPDGDGISLLEELRGQGIPNPYIVMTDYDEVPTAVKSMKSGAEDYIPKKLLADNLPPLLRALQRRLERHTAPVHERNSEAFRKIDHRIRIVAQTDISVLVLGENGTGKEHIAEKVHARSRRTGKPFVAVDCGVLSKELAASALFGHEKGAFTGADTRKKGYFEEAEDGTLFLDEVGNLPPEVQQMLLRAIQNRRYRPVGSGKDKAANVRVIAATNEDLTRAVGERRFRQDLYQRLKEFVIQVPPLRECREDILPLADFFREQANEEFGKGTKGFDAEAKRKLLSHTWPGNVRELKQTIRMAVLLAESETLTADELETEEAATPVESTLALKDEAAERERILRALEQAGGNRSQAAELLGIGRTTLYNKLKAYGIE